jgi:hypothetical protein
VRIQRLRDDPASATPEASPATTEASAIREDLQCHAQNRGLPLREVNSAARVQMVAAMIAVLMIAAIMAQRAAM